MGYLHQSTEIKIHFISWREAHSSTGRLVTGGGGNTKLAITRSIFELEARDFAWKLIWTVEPNDKVQKYKSTKVQKYKSTKVQKYKNTKIQKYKNTKIQKYKS